MRPGANMGILNWDHPDVLEFIAAKRGEAAITNFNISVGATDLFMEQVTRGDESVTELWDAIIDGAWRNGEPGLIFLDTINRMRLHPEVIEATNPCGEVPLLPYEACVLGTVNLAAHVTHTHMASDPEQAWLGMDEVALAATCRTMVRTLDNIIDMQDYPLPIIEQTHKRYRKIGVNPAGLASALILCGLDYASGASLKMQDRWARIMRDACYAASEELAHEKGPYPGYYGETEVHRTPQSTGLNTSWDFTQMRVGESGGFKYHRPVREHNGQLMPFRRNLCCMVGAPTGTTSRLLQTDFAIEPPMGKEVTSFVVGGIFTERHPLADHPGFFTYEDVSIDDHVNVLATWQKHIDQAVSKTLMLPHDATREDVEHAYVRAWRAGCKGVTLLREASREDNVLVGVAGDCVGDKCAI
jgi:ribonucleoside-diphosphate reductase alpha chain